MSAAQIGGWVIVGLCVVVAGVVVYYFCKVAKYDGDKEE